MKVRKDHIITKDIDNELIEKDIEYAYNNKDRKNILIVVHEFRKRESKLLGGTVLHIYDLIDNLRDTINFHVLYPQNGQYRVKSFFENSTSEIILGKIQSFEKVMTHNIKYKNVIQKVFDYINIDIVHIHHLFNHYFDIFDVISEKNIPYIISLHDFYMVCPTFSLLENNEKYCGDNEKRNCVKCLKKIKNIEGEFINIWRNLSYKALKNAKEIIVPTNSTREIVNKYFEDLSIKVINHGVEIMEYEYEKKIVERNKNIAFLGGINEIKGIKFLEKFIDEVNKKDSKYNLHLFGTTSNSKLNESNGNYIVHGMYNREDIIKLLKENEIDIICLFSICPETYSYTLTESLIAGIPVIVLDYGALAERVKMHNVGWVLEREVEFVQIMEVIKNIFDNPNEYNLKIKNIEDYLKSAKNTKEMANEYKEIYDANFRNKLIDGINGELRLVLEYSKQILEQEEQIIYDQEKFIEHDGLFKDYQKRVEEYDGRINEYHNSVMEYRNEIDRLNIEIQNYKLMEEKYNRLITSRKLKLLKKFKFIEF